MRKDIGWFDSKNRAPGILTNILTEDISSVNGLTTESLGIAVEAALGLFFSCLISGLFFGYSQAIRFAFIAFVFYVAAVCVQRYDLDSEDVFTGCYVVFVGSIGSGVSIS